MGEKQTPLNTDEYCREIESYLCRKNDGHLIRIVGPSFARVCGWAAQDESATTARMTVEAANGARRIGERSFSAAVWLRQPVGLRGTRRTIIQAQRDRN